MTGERKDIPPKPARAPEQREPGSKQDIPPKERDELDERSLDDVLRECPL